MYVITLLCVITLFGGSPPPPAPAPLPLPTPRCARARPDGGASTARWGRGSHQLRDAHDQPCRAYQARSAALVCVGPTARGPAAGRTRRPVREGVHRVGVAHEHGPMGARGTTKRCGRERQSKLSLSPLSLFSKRPVGEGLHRLRPAGHARATVAPRSWAGGGPHSRAWRHASGPHSRAWRHASIAW